MKTTLELPFPSLCEGRFACVRALTDDQLFASHRIRIAFTERSGGTSVGAYDSLNLGLHVEDDPRSVAANRALLSKAFGTQDLPCITPLQVHGEKVIVLKSAEEEAIAAFRSEAEEGADGLVIEPPGCAALLCFADCVPVIEVSPSGFFAVVHAGWRGVESGIAVKACKMLKEADEAAGYRTNPSEYNIYVGPYIHAECFETGADVSARFEERFGQDCLEGSQHIDLACALKKDLMSVGVVEERFVDAGICTVCNTDRFYSYRAQNGVCGRHGAYAIRMAGVA